MRDEKWTRYITITTVPYAYHYSMSVDGLVTARQKTSAYSMPLQFKHVIQFYESKVEILYSALCLRYREFFAYV